MLVTTQGNCEVVNLDDFNEIQSELKCRMFEDVAEIVYVDEEGSQRPINLNASKILYKVTGLKIILKGRALFHGKVDSEGNTMDIDNDLEAWIIDTFKDDTSYFSLFDDEKQQDKALDGDT